MLFVVILAVAGLVVGWLMVKHKKDKLVVVDYIEGAVTSVLFGLLGSILGLIIAGGVGAVLPKEYVLDKRIELVAIQDIGGIQGRFFLGTGTMESTSYYVFYQQDGSGVRFGRIPAEDAVVYVEERNDGLIKEYDKRFTAEWYNLFGITPGKRYEIFIPQGSILHESNLDLK